MRKTCKVCDHKKVAQINEKIRNGDSISSISKLYAISRDTITRHRDECMAKLLAEDKEAKEAIVGDSLIKQVREQIDYLHKIIVACDEWLTDPEDESKYYLGPRGEEVEIVYQQVDPDSGRITPSQRKATLQEILQAVESHGYIVRGVKFSHSDPRELLIKGIGKLEGTVKMIHETSQRLIEWEHKKKALAKLDADGTGDITFEEQVNNITRRIIVSREGKHDNGDLCEKAGMPKIAPGKQ